MTGLSTFPLGRAARRSLAVATLALGSTLSAWAQDDQAPPPADQVAPPATPEPNAATPETTPTVPVQAEVGKAAAPAESKDSTQLEAIEVTGSRLKRTDYESAQPVVSISREDIERSGLTDISQILRHLTVAGNNSATPQQGRFALSLGEVNLDLRNLGAQHTLLLVNGRRWVTGLIPTQPSVSDYNTIPTSIIERVEILKDGASAIYGSDAIGGVVNVITRKDYEGFGVSYQLGQFAKYWDGTNQQASLNWGKTMQGQSIFVNLSYTGQDRASNEVRPLTATPANGIARQSAVTTRGTVIMILPSTNQNATYYGCPAALGDTEQIPFNGGIGPTQVGAGLSQCTLQRNVPDAGGATLGDWHQGARTDPNVSPNDVANRFGNGSLTEPNTRTSLYTQYTLDLADHISFAFDGLYNIRQSTSVGQRGYTGGGDQLVPGSKSWLAYIPSSDPSNPWGQDVGRDNSCASQEDPTCTHLGLGTGLWALRLGGDSDNDEFHDTVKTARFSGGFRGDFELVGLPLSWDAGYIWARSKIEEVFPNARFDLEANALQNPNATGACVAPCAPLDVLHGQAGLTRAALDYIYYDAWQHNGNRQDIYYADLSGEFPAFSWLAGPISVATGLEYRRDQFQSYADPILQQALVQLNKLTDTSGKTSAQEAYLEFGIPLFQDQFLLKALDLDVAGRYSKYPTFGNVTTYKGGVRWKPVDDLLVRGTYSTGFRAPNVGELFNGKSQSYDGVVDPCVNTDPPTTTTNVNCASDGAQGGGGGQVGVVQPYDNWQGNPDLKPEKSKNLTYGLVYSPHFVPDLNFNLDFYDIKVDNFIVIGGLVGQYFLDSCEKLERPSGAAPNSGPYCDRIHRDSAGDLLFVDTPWFNLAGIETSGVDGGVDYILPVPDAWGRFKFSVEASYLTKFDQTTPHVGAAVPDVTGLVGSDQGQFSGYPRWKAGSVLSWKRDVWNVSWSTRMAYHMTEPCNDVFDALDHVALHGVCSNPKNFTEDDPTTPNVDETTQIDPARSENVMRTIFYHNLQLGRDITTYNANLTFGINNVLNTDPPISRSNIGVFWYNYDPNQYEAPGRQVYLRAEMKF